jgi:hypothetical protein
MAGSITVRGLKAEYRRDHWNLEKAGSVVTLRVCPIERQVKKTDETIGILRLAPLA